MGYGVGSEDGVYGTSAAVVNFLLDLMWFICCEYVSG